MEEGAVVVMSLEYITTCFDPFENDGYEDLGVTDSVISPCLREVPLQSPPPRGMRWELERVRLKLSLRN